MSFDYNPYRHIELVQSDVDASLWFWHCHGCGADGNRSGVGELPFAETGKLAEDFFRHIQKSHARTRIDFESWGKW